MIPLINRIAEITRTNTRRGATSVQTRGATPSSRTERTPKVSSKSRESAAKRRAYTQQLAGYSSKFVDSKDLSEHAESTAASSLRQRQQLWQDLGAASSVLSSSFDASSEENDDLIPVQNSQYPVIHPNGRWKLWWDVWVRLLVLYNVIAVPFRIGFDVPSRGAVLGFDIVGDVCFAVDMLVSFRTAFFNEDGELVTSTSEIARRYLRGEFWVDLLSTIPFDYVAMLFALGRPQLWRITKVLRMLRLAKLFRLLRTRKASRGLELANERQELGGLWGLLELLLKLGFVAHLFGCVWHWTTVLHGDDEAGITWSEAYGIDGEGLARRYAASVYYAYTTMSTIGYGDITPANDRERGVAVVAEIVGASFFGYVIGNITAMVAQLNLADSLENERLDAVKEYVQDRKFPRALASRIIRQYKYHYKHGSPFDVGPLLEGLPANTCTALLLAHYQDLIQHVSFLQSSHPQFVTYFVQKMKPFFANRGEVLLYQGELGLQMFFLGKGSVALLVTDGDGEGNSDGDGGQPAATQKVATITNGSFFGEAAILLDVGQPYTAIATSFCEMYFVSREDVLAAIEEWPALKHQLEQQTQQVMEAVESAKQQRHKPVQEPPALRLKVSPAPSSTPRSAFEIESPSPTEAPSEYELLRSPAQRLFDDEMLSELHRAEEQRKQDTPDSLWRRQRIIHPDAPAKAIWDVFVCVLIVYSVVMVSFRLSFNQDPSIAGTVLDTVVDVSFFLDILLTFRTAYYDEQGVLVTDATRIAHTYLTGWFTLDLISTVPLDRMLGGVVSNSAALRSTKLLRIIRLVRFVKVMRLLKVSGFFEKYEETLPVNVAVVRILKLVLIFVFAAHIIACIWFAVGSHHGSSWIKEYCFPTSTDSGRERCLDAAHVSSQYLAAVYWAVTTMSTVGYGDLTPSSSSTGEIAAAMVAQIISTTLYAYIIGTLVSLILNLSPRDRAEKRQRRMFVEYMNAVGVPAATRKTAFRQFAFRLQFKSVFREQEILSGLPTHLRSRCFAFLYRNYLPHLPIACSLEARFPGAIMAVLPLLRPAYYVKGEVLFSPRMDTREAAFLVRGACECVDNSTKAQVAHYRAGDHFGAEQILVPAYVPFVLQVEVRALTNVKVLLLSRDDFWHLQQTCPRLAELFEKTLGAGADRDRWMHFPDGVTM